MERILCAAIHYDINSPLRVHQPKNIKGGFVICGYRHHNIIATYNILTGGNTKNEIQGFLTSTGRFVDRKEAFNIARDANQFFKGVVSHHSELYSEDLY
jgi:hypothetical protein